MADQDNELTEAIQEFTDELHGAALNFFEEGMRVFYRERGKGFRRGQVALALLAISVELFLKKFIARKNITLVFKEIPLEFRTALLVPGGVPRNMRLPTLIWLRAGEFKLVEVNDAITLYLHFRPERRPLKAHLEGLVKARNASVHGVLPEQAGYQLERAGYCALQIAREMMPSYAYTAEDEAFLREFQEERIKKVEQALSAARKAAKQLPDESPGVSVTSWSDYLGPCPVCRRQALFHGDSVLQGAEEQDQAGASLATVLMFYATALECSSCGLNLDDAEELRLAGVDIDIDRPDDDTHRFLADRGAAGLVLDHTRQGAVSWRVLESDGQRHTILSITGRPRGQVLRDLIEHSLDDARTRRPVAVTALVDADDPGDTDK